MASANGKRKYADLHSHTPLSGHAAGEAEEYAAQAIAAGLAFYGCSDHFPLPEGYPTRCCIPFEQYPLYRDNWMPRLRKTLEGSGVELLYGTEFDFLPGRMERTRPAMDAEPFDYRISSIHFIDEVPVDNTPEEWDAVGGTEQMWSLYADRMAQMVSEGNFEIIGHMDLPKKFNVYPADRSKYVLAMHDILKVAAEKGICMELNTAGLRKAAKEIYPTPAIVKMAFDAGVGLTFGSDSHLPREVGQDFDLAEELARSVGYKCINTFRQKQRIELPFD